MNMKQTSFYFSYYILTLHCYSFNLLALSFAATDFRPSLVFTDTVWSSLIWRLNVCFANEDGFKGSNNIGITDNNAGGGTTAMETSVDCKCRSAAGGIGLPLRWYLSMYVSMSFILQRVSFTGGFIVPKARLQTVTVSCRKVFRSRQRVSCLYCVGRRIRKWFNLSLNILQDFSTASPQRVLTVST